jgi:hypothetical protein
MNAVGLPARVAYSVVALPAGGAAGFYGTLAYPRAWKLVMGTDLEYDPHRLFLTAMGVGAGVAFTAFLVALTLPWKRLRRRRGRIFRVGLSGIVVLIASLCFAGQGHTLIDDVLFAAWLAYTMAFTFVRYGVLDRSRRAAGGSGDDGSAATT